MTGPKEDINVMLFNEYSNQKHTAIKNEWILIISFSEKRSNEI